MGEAGDDAASTSTSQTQRDGVNHVLQGLMRAELDPNEIGVEEIFDILPLYGVLHPGETELVTLTFFGHADILSEAHAVCEVEGGPAYDLEIKGQASLVEYEFDTKEIDLGKQVRGGFFCRFRLKCFKHS